LALDVSIKEFGGTSKDEHLSDTNLQNKFVFEDTLLEGTYQSCFGGVCKDDNRYD
jgi:hypothetical protein